MACLAFFSTACEKYLTEPSDKSYAVITTLGDLQALLDNQTRTNAATAISPDVSADDYFLQDDGWANLQYEEDQRMYIWERDNVFNPGDLGNDWSRLYGLVYLTNTVLEHLEQIEIDEANVEQWNNIKGQALVFRAVSFLDAAQIWAEAYDAATAQTITGIPLRLESDFNIPSARSSLQNTYDQILADLKEAVPLLPITPVAKTRPSKPAAYGLLARTHLWMRDYATAGIYADSCLMLANGLMNYNELNSASSLPIPRHNEEVIFERTGALGQILARTRAKVPLCVFNSYSNDDLRKHIFFTKNSENDISFKSFYTGIVSRFLGIATDEMYLIRAECFARNDQIAEAIHDLNTLIRTRWRKETFKPFTASSANQALDIVLNERRKQLILRGIRWMDIKRLNKEGAGITLTRDLNGKTYTLPAGSDGFVLPLPDDLIAYFN